MSLLHARPDHTTPPVTWLARQNEVQVRETQTAYVFTNKRSYSKYLNSSGKGAPAVQCLTVAVKHLSQQERLRLYWWDQHSTQDSGGIVARRLEEEHTSSVVATAQLPLSSPLKRETVSMNPSTEPQQSRQILTTRFPSDISWTTWLCPHMP